MRSPHTLYGVTKVMLGPLMMVLGVMGLLVKGEMPIGESPCRNKMVEGCDPPKPVAYKSDDKIIGGMVADPGSTPWLVSLQDTNYLDPVPFCGGTLINFWWILTSASCVEPYQSSVYSILIVLGEYNMETWEGYEEYRWAVYIALHPDYDPYSYHADIALVMMDQFVLYGERISPLKLPGSRQKGNRQLKPGGLLTIAGWGRIGEGGEMSHVVRCADVPLLSRDECMTAYPDLTSTMICAGNFTHGGLDPCQGDLGGGLATPDRYITGVSSWSVGCGRPGFPGVYTDVSEVMDWICDVTDLKSNNSRLRRLPQCRKDQ